MVWFLWIIYFFFAKNVNIIEEKISLQVVNLYKAKPWQKESKNRDLIVFGAGKEFRRSPK